MNGIWPFEVIILPRQQLSRLFLSRQYKRMQTPSPVRPGEPTQSEKRDERRGQADHPAFARSSLASQHLLHKPLASRHLVEALLIGSDAPYFFVRQWLGLKACCLL